MSLGGGGPGARSRFHETPLTLRRRHPALRHASAAVQTAGRSRLTSNRRFARVRRPRWLRPREARFSRILASRSNRRPQAGLNGSAAPTVKNFSPSAGFGGVIKSRHRPTCREWPQPSPNRQFVNRPTLAEAPLTGLSLSANPICQSMSPRKFSQTSLAENEKMVASTSSGRARQEARLCG